MKNTERLSHERIEEMIKEAEALATDDMMMGFLVGSSYRTHQGLFWNRNPDVLGARVCFFCLGGLGVLVCPGKQGMMIFVQNISVDEDDNGPMVLVP